MQELLMGVLSGSSFIAARKSKEDSRKINLKGYLKDTHPQQTLGKMDLTESLICGSVAQNGAQLGGR